MPRAQDLRLQQELFRSRSVIRRERDVRQGRKGLEHLSQEGCLPLAPPGNRRTGDRIRPLRHRSAGTQDHNTLFVDRGSDDTDVREVIRHQKGDCHNHMSVCVCVISHADVEKPLYSIPLGKTTGLTWFHSRR